MLRLVGDSSAVELVVESLGTMECLPQVSDLSLELSQTAPLYLGSPDQEILAMVLVLSPSFLRDLVLSCL